MILINILVVDMENGTRRFFRERNEMLNWYGVRDGSDTARCIDDAITQAHRDGTSYLGAREFRAQ